jgi:surfeit locus 1 family protein
MSLGAAALCIRLGFWQLDRLHQRRERNAEAGANLAQTPLQIPPLSGDFVRYRRVSATGVFDFSREFVLAGRARNGNPGVYIITPLVMAGTDTLLLVARGWAYSPDASTLDLSAWRERDSATVAGYLVGFDPVSKGADTSASGVVRRIVRATAERRMGAPVAPFYVIMTGGGGSGDSVPARLESPVSDEGPHLSYTVQWFLFATIFGAGGVFVALRKQAPHSQDRST